MLTPSVTRTRQQSSEIFKEQEEQKKSKHQQRVLNEEIDSFTPLVFGTNGGMGNEYQCFLKHLAEGHQAV